MALNKYAKRGVVSTTAKYYALPANRDRLQFEVPAAQ